MTPKQKEVEEWLASVGLEVYMRNFLEQVRYTKPNASGHGHAHATDDYEARPSHTTRDVAVRTLNRALTACL